MRENRKLFSEVKKIVEKCYGTLLLLITQIQLGWSNCKSVRMPQLLTAIKEKKEIQTRNYEIIFVYQTIDFQF